MLRYELIFAVNLLIGTLLSLGTMFPLWQARTLMRTPGLRAIWLGAAAVLALYLGGVPIAIGMIVTGHLTELLVMSSLYVILASGAYLASIIFVRALLQSVHDERNAASEKKQMLEHYQTNLESLIRRRTAQLSTEVQLRAEAEQEARRRFSELDQELEFAALVQAGVLQDLPEPDWLETCLWYQPCARVSGDWYRVQPGPAGALNLTVADASGHGAAAAYLSVMADIVLSGIKPESGPVEVCELLNDRLAAYPITLYLTAVVASLSPDGRLRYSLAGHPPLLILRASGDIDKPIAECGAAIGMFADPPVPYPLFETQLEAGDLLVLYTDGILDCRNERGERFEAKRLQSALAAAGGQTAEQAVATLREHWHQHCGLHPPQDDLTLLALRYTGSH